MGLMKSLNGREKKSGQESQEGEEEPLIRPLDFSSPEFFFSPV